MNHKPYVDWMHAALDGEISSTERRELTEHLTACTPCQATWEALTVMQRTFKAEPPAAPAPGFAARFRARQAARRSRARLFWGSLVLSVGAVGTLSAAAAAFTLALGALFSAAQVARQPSTASALYSSGLAMFTFGGTIAQALWTVFGALAHKALVSPLAWGVSLAAVAVVAAWAYLVLKLKPEVVLQ